MHEGKLRLVKLIMKHLNRLNESTSYYNEMLTLVKEAHEVHKTIECPYCIGKGHVIHAAYLIREEICEVCEGSGEI